jgi:Siphovirus Gp157
MPERLDPTFLRALIEALRVTYPAVWEDEADRLLMLASETGFNESLTAVVKQDGETEILIKGIDEWIANLKARHQRFEQRSDAMRSFAFKVMTAAAVKKVELPLATLSIRAGVPRVIITDETALPPSCVRIRTEPDKIAIKEQLMRGEQVPGAALSNAEPTLAVRVK